MGLLLWAPLPMLTENHEHRLYYYLFQGSAEPFFRLAPRILIIEKVN